MFPTHEGVIYFKEISDKGDVVPLVTTKDDLPWHGQVTEQTPLLDAERPRPHHKRGGSMASHSLRRQLYPAGNQANKPRYKFKVMPIEGLTHHSPFCCQQFGKPQLLAELPSTKSS